MLAMAVLPTRPESQSCHYLTQPRKFFGRSSRTRVNYAALRARKITGVFERQWWRGIHLTVEILRCFDSRGSFRLFQQQSPGCHYHLVIFCGAADRFDATNFDTALPFRGYLPFATTLRRIRNRQLQKFRTASRFTRFDDWLRNHHSITSQSSGEVIIGQTWQKFQTF